MISQFSSWVEHLLVCRLLPPQRSALSWRTSSTHTPTIPTGPSTAHRVQRSRSPLFRRPPFGRSCGTLCLPSVHHTRFPHTRGDVTCMYSVVKIRLSVERRKGDVYGSAYLARVFALFPSPTIYLRCSGAHAEQEPSAVPLNYRARLPGARPIVSCGRISKTRCVDRDASSRGRCRGPSCD